MSTQLLIGASAGLVSAALFTSAAAAGVFAGIPFYLSPLPLCLAGLGWGRAAVLIAVVAGTLAMAITISASLALTFGLILALPIATLVHLLLLARPAPQQDSASAGALEWYPPGRLLGWAALIAGFLAGILVLGLGPDMETYRQSVGSLLKPELLEMLDPDGSIFTQDTVDSLKVVLTKTLPAVFAVVWLIIVLFNLWLAGLIVEASGRALRPWPDLHGLEVPNAFVAVFAVALVLSFVPGILGVLATGFAGAMLFAYVLQGLAVIHTYSHGLSLRPLLLTAVYIGILFLGWVAIVVAIIGLGEPLFGLRSRGNRPPNASATKDNEKER
jgi:hypothetical protein